MMHVVIIAIEFAVLSLAVWGISTTIRALRSEKPERLSDGRCGDEDVRERPPVLRLPPPVKSDWRGRE